MSREAVGARLRELARLYVPQSVDEIPAETEDPLDTDMSPEGVGRRLDELRSLWRFSQWAHGEPEDGSQAHGEPQD